MDTINADFINNMNIDTYKWLIPVIIAILALFMSYIVYLLKNKDGKISELNKEIVHLKELNNGITEESKQSEQDRMVIPQNDDRSWHELDYAATNIVEQIEKDKFVPSIIVGIGRGGGILGAIISYKLYHLPVFVVDREYDWKTKKRKQNILFDFEMPAFYMDNILLVAGEAHTGETMACFEKHLLKKGAGVVKTCVFYKQTICNVKIDYYSNEGENVPLMPWQDKGYIRDSISETNLNVLKKWREEIDTMDGKTIYIVRHGETNHNKNDVFIGTTLSSINTKGRQQIEGLAKYLNNTECLRANNTVIISSDQDRGLQTSSIIGEKIGIKDENIKQSHDLRERDYGKWEGKNRKQIMCENGNDYEKYEKDALNFCPPDAEPLISVIHRTQRLIDTLGDQEEENIVIVTHKTTGRLLLSYFTRSFYSKYREIGFKNGSLSKFTIKEGDIKTVYLNKTDY